MWASFSVKTNPLRLFAEAVLAGIHLPGGFTLCKHCLFRQMCHIRERSSRECNTLPLHSPF